MNKLVITFTTDMTVCFINASEMNIIMKTGLLELDKEEFLEFEKKISCLTSQLKYKNNVLIIIYIIFFLFHSKWSNYQSLTMLIC
jgi:hypothetical protein